MAEPGQAGPLAAVLDPAPGPVGLGWRPEIDGFAGSLAGRIAFAEAIAENVHPPHLPPGLAALVGSGTPVVPHGVTLSLGGVAEPDPRRVAHLAACAQALGSPLVSEHVAFVRAEVDGVVVESGHLLPVPRTREALDVLTRNIRLVQAELPVPLAVEPIAALLDLGGDYDEASFLTELVERTDVWLLPDVHNAYANALNHGGDPGTFLTALPAQRLAYAHMAGGRWVDGLYRDTHLDPVSRDVLGLLAGFAETRAEAGAGPLPVLLERDGEYPPAAEFLAELDAVREAAQARR
ncbi:MAG TPA: DUF692 domain-containing protein [Kineosporiaceae bacterium]|nr:DUF692 domain-containing protein [Kineosporiaceae bacterium]